MKKSIGLFVSILCLAIMSQPVFAKKINWRLVTHSMPGTEQQKLVKIFADTVKELSDGQFIIKTYPAGVLFPVFETFDNVKNGLVNAAMVYGAYWPGKDPLFSFTTQPGSPLSTYAEGAYLVEKLEPWTKKLYAKHGITYLGHAMVSPLYEQLMSVVPIKSVEDISGLRIRTSGIGGKYYSALGATTVSLSAPDIYTALQTKNIEAAEWTFWDENMRMGFHEVAKYVLDPALQNGTCEYFPLVVNPKNWESLPENFQNILLVARDKIRYLSAMIYNKEIMTREKWKALPNVQTIKWSDSDMAKARLTGHQVVRQAAEKSPEGTQFLNIYRNTLYELGYKEDARALGYSQ